MYVCMYVQWVGTFGLTMYSTGGNAEMIQMSCFSNMKIYTRYMFQRVYYSVYLCKWLLRRINTAVFDKGCPKKKRKKRTRQCRKLVWKIPNKFQLKLRIHIARHLKCSLYSQGIVA